MKKIIFLLFVLSSIFVNGQATCNQTFTTSGLDNDPTVLTINAVDLTCNGGNAPTALKLINADTPGNCGNWFSFDLVVDGTTLVTNGCNASFDNIDITGFTTLTITSHDDDNWAPGDAVTITIDVEVTFVPTSPPTCDAILTSPMDGVTNAPLDGNISWSGASGGVSGYFLTVGTTPGGTDVLATTDVGNVNTYALGALPQGTTYYITIMPYNAIGNATGCTEQSFTTFSAVVSDITTYTEAQLIEDVLIQNSDCAVVSNIQFSTHSAGADTGIGYFSYPSATGFPFADGLMLSSGRVSDADGPYADFGSPSFSAVSPGDTDLENILGITTTNDASYIEFDFVPVTDQISFNFLMASSEYDGPTGTFQCTYEDAFAFILTDAAGVETNLAVLPTTNTATNVVSVTNIHPEVVGSCAEANEIYFDSYATPGDPIAYQGRTVPLVATSPVTPGQMYHIKLVVADQSDFAFDTTIFIEGGSFSLGNLNLGNDVFLGDPEALCQGDTTTLNAGVLSPGTEITWYQNGNVVTGSTMVNTMTGETEQILVIDTTGDYVVEITYTGTTCSFTDTVHKEFYPIPSLDLGVDVIKCANEELLLEANVTNATDPNMGPLAYQWYYNGIAIPGATADTYLITATSFTGSNGNANGTAQFTSPVDGSLVYISTTTNQNGAIVYQFGEFSVIVDDTTTPCSGEDSMIVSFYENANCIIIPSGISPNNDGVNDCLVLDDLDASNDISKMQVYNRYGVHVFEGSNYIREWCGTNKNGELLPTGTYYYILEFTDGRTPLKGWIYINKEK